MGDMDIKQINDGLYSFFASGEQRHFAFLSQTALRIHSASSPKSYCADPFTPEKGGQVLDQGEQACFAYGNLSVYVDEVGDIKALLGKKTVLVLRPLTEYHQEVTFEMLLKEGHRSGGNEGYHGGFEIQNDRPVYGNGERTGPLDKRGYSYINWNTDDPAAHVDTFPSLYQSMPFFLLFSPEETVGVFIDNPSKMRFDFNKSDPHAVKVEYEEPYLDLYVFVGSLPHVIAEFTKLTGRNPLTPYWALGAQQSRWSYASAEAVDRVIEGYQKAEIPLSVVYLDIDYMDHYKDFSVNRETFPRVGEWIKQKNEQGVRIVPIIDAGVKAEPGYDIYDEGMANGYFCTQYGNVYHNEVWPGDSVFPAFLAPAVQQWWADHIASFLGLGFDGIWNDMNEPASFRDPLPLDVEMGEGVPHRIAHNVYGHSMVKAGALGFEKAKKRLFQLTRAGYAGTCRYSSSWAGDNQSIYEHLRLSFPQMMNMSLSGQAYIGVDVGGFGGDTTEELLVRWAIAAIFFPLYRNHSSLGTKDQEPYHLQGKALENYRKAVLTRYELLPTLYDQLYFAESEGSVPLRPLIYNYPFDARVINENTEIMLGEDLLLAPALFPGQEVRSCYFPEPFYDYFSGQRYEAGDQLISVSMDHIPLFIRERGLVALAPKGNDKAEPSSTLRLRYGPKAGKRLHYEDEGDGLGYREGRYNLFELEVEQGRVNVKYLHHGMKTRYQSIELESVDGKVVCLPFPKAK